MSAVSIDQAPAARNSWIVTVLVDFPYDYLLDPRMWAHLANRLNIRDQIEVWAEDLSWGAEFRVIDKGTFGIKVAEWTGKKEFTTSVPLDTIPEGYFIDYKGPMLRYCIFRKADGKRLQERVADKAGALAWLASYLASQKAA